MKTILFLLLSFTCHAQQGVTLEYIGDPFEIQSLEPKFDTTKIVMLVSDTTDVYPTQHQIHENHFITIKPTSPNWMYGYLVTELSEKPGTHNVIFPEHPMRLIFLDLGKKQISKEIIIWDWKKVE